jgi:hypothetical protein
MRHEARPGIEGALLMKGTGFNGHVPIEQVATNTARVNTPKELTKRFFGEDNLGTVAGIPFEDGSQIRIHRPTGPYTPNGLMIIAHGPDFSKYPQDKPIQTEQIYTYPEKVQAAYWNTIVQTLATYESVLGSNKHIFSGGNHLANYSNKQERTARTIGLPHDHFCAIDERDMADYIDGGVAGIPGYMQQQEITRHLSRVALPRMKRTFPDVELYAREHLPYGYSFVVGAHETPERFAEIMRANYESYKAIAEPYIRKGIVPIMQPSFQVYIQLGDRGARHITTVPSFMSPSGVMEAVGIQSRRDLSYPNSSNEEVDNKIMEKLNTLTNRPALTRA